MALIVVKRPSHLLARLTALGEKLYRDGYTAEQIADACNTEIRPELPVGVTEADAWIKTYGWLRRPEPKRGERLTPEPTPTPSEPWKPMWRSWMEDTNP